MVLVIKKLLSTGSPPLTWFFGPGKNHVKGIPGDRRSTLVLKPWNREYESSKSPFWANCTTNKSHKSGELLVAFPIVYHYRLLIQSKVLSLLLNCTFEEKNVNFLKKKIRVIGGVPVFKKISSLFVFSPMYTNEIFSILPLLLEPTHLLNLDKNYSLPFY